MSKLKNINQIDDEKIIDDIFSQEIVIFEDVQGSKIYVNISGDNVTIKPKSLINDPINLIDLAMQNYYNKSISFFKGLSERVKSLLNKNWWFCFEYFPDNQPANIDYNRVPKNHLVLTSIYKGNKFDYTPEELEEYGRLLDVEVIPYIFQGKMSQEKISAIKYFLNTSEKDLEFVFGEKSFAYFFYKLLSPQTQNSFLMVDDFQKNLEKLILRVKGMDHSFEILNPLYQRISETNSTDFVEIYTLILINFLNFSQSINVSDLKIRVSRRDEAYINIICQIFNIYMNDVKDDLIKFELIIPQFFDKDKFRINRELIPNKLTKELITEDKKIEYVFKIILGSFNKPKKKAIGLFTESTIEIFNNFVKSIENKIDEYFMKKSEIELTKSGLMDFSDYIDIKFDEDGIGQVYPDVYTEIEKNKSPQKKSKKEKLK